MRDLRTVCLLLCMSAPGLAAAAPVLHTIAATGDPAPGVTGGVFQDVREASIDDTGRVAFFASVAAPAGTRRGIWTEAAGGTLQPVAIEGDPTPDGGTFESLTDGAYPPHTLVAGDWIVFWARVGGLASVWSFDGTTLQRLVTEGEAIPGGGNVAAIDSFEATNLRRELLVRDPIGLVFRATDGSLTRVITYGGPVPGMPSSNVSGLWDATLDDTGAMWMFVKQGNGDLNDAMLVGGMPGDLGVVVSSGMVVPGLAPGDVYSATTAVLPAGDGSVYFNGYVNNPGVMDSGWNGVWYRTPDGALIEVARQGLVVDGFTTSLGLGGIDAAPGGHLVMGAQGPDMREALIGFANGTPSLIAAVYQDGVTYFSTPVVNAVDQVAFLAISPSALYLSTPGVGKEAVVVIGETTDLGDGRVVSVDNAQFVGIGDYGIGGRGRVRSLNARSELAFTLGFHTPAGPGSAIVIAERDPPPPADVGATLAIGTSGGDGEIPLVVTVTNHGPTDIDGALLEITAAAVGADVASGALVADPASGCAASIGRLVCSAAAVGALAPGASRDLYVSFTYDATFGGHVTVTATATVPGDVNAANDVASVGFDVDGPSGGGGGAKHSSGCAIGAAGAPSPWAAVMLWLALAISYCSFMSKRNRLRAGCVVALAAIGLACQSSTSVGALGTVALSEAGTGDLLIVDVATGDQRRIPKAIAPAGAIYLSPNGSQVAYAIEPELFDRRVRVADVATGQVSELFPSTGQMMPLFTWGGPDWFSYPTYASGESRSYLVGPGANAVREMSNYDYTLPVGSRDGTWLAHANCESAPLPTCPRTLVIERPNGSDRRVLATGVPNLNVIGFSPDATQLYSIEGADGGRRLTARDGSSGETTDLGEAGEVAGWPVWFPSNTEVISPAGDEILVLRAGELTAVRVDGTGARIIDTRWPSRAGFTARGDVVWQVDDNLNPGSDLPVYEYTVFVLDTDGRRVIHPADQDCESVMVSPTGDLLALSCGGRIVVKRLGDGSVVREHEGMDVLGFVAGDAGLVISRSTDSSYRFEVWYAPMQGEARLLGVAGYMDGGTGDQRNNVAWPPFSFAP